MTTTILTHMEEIINKNNLKINMDTLTTMVTVMITATIVIMKKRKNTILMENVMGTIMITVIAIITVIATKTRKMSIIYLLFGKWKY
jgi:pheromone shutdown protein TraB